jgi:hypothetical protein
VLSKGNAIVVANPSLFSLICGGSEAIAATGYAGRLSLESLSRI